ncbi:MAG: hypothetical protein AAF065_13095 [Verrucomicrobiota bacterium]
MTDLANQHFKQVTSLFVKLGAEKMQAEVMARQLLRRAQQIAQERGISEVDALGTLLKQVVEARHGP